MSIPIGKVCRALRLKAGKSLTATADAAGLDHADLSKFERGLEGVSLGGSSDRLERIARAIGVSVAHIVDVAETWALATPEDTK